jgi:predicted nucleotidyltransferase
MAVVLWCRDILHNARGNTLPTAATGDLEVGLALSSWDAYRELTASFRMGGNTGICHPRLTSTAGVLCVGSGGACRGPVGRLGVIRSARR